MRRLGAILMLSSSQFQLDIFSGLDANLQLMTQEQKLWREARVAVGSCRWQESIGEL
jgi:hypothetical protein